MFENNLVQARGTLPFDASRDVHSAAGSRGMVGLERQTMKRREPFAEAGGAVGFLRDAELMVVDDRKGSSVEEFVVHAAEGETVGFNVRAACLMPFDVGRLQSNLN